MSNPWAFHLGLATSLLIAIPASASAQTWRTGNGSSCLKVCDGARLSAVISGRYKDTGPLGGRAPNWRPPPMAFTVCRDAEGRPGYNLEGRWYGLCYVARGGKEIGADRFECLCK